MSTPPSTLERPVSQPLRPAGWRQLMDNGTESTHSVRCPCLTCAHFDRIDTPPYRPTYALRVIGQLWPDVEWLAWLPLADRRWYRVHQDELMRRYSDVPGEAWARLFP